MDWKKGEDYYYFIYYPKYKEFGLAKVFVRGHTDSLFASLTIEKIYNKTNIGFQNRIYQGAEISANELQGVGGDGPDNYFFKTNKDLFDKIFKINR